MFECMRIVDQFMHECLNMYNGPSYYAYCYNLHIPDSNDQEFVLTAEMMVDAEDYEATIDEEEEMEDEDDDDDELADLQKVKIILHG